MSTKYFSKNGYCDMDLKIYLLGNTVYDLMLVPVMKHYGDDDVKDNVKVINAVIVMAAILYAYVALRGTAFQSKGWWKFMVIVNGLASLNFFKRGGKLDDFGWLISNDLAKAVVLYLIYRKRFN